MSIAQANKLTTGSKVYYRDLINLQDYAATVTAITPGKTLTVSVTAPGLTLNYGLGGETTPEIPLYPLN
jgi:hypothetical protein